jgi:hypothetical protein
MKGKEKPPPAHYEMPVLQLPDLSLSQCFLGCFCSSRCVLPLCSEHWKCVVKCAASLRGGYWDDNSKSHKMLSLLLLFPHQDH